MLISSDHGGCTLRNVNMLSFVFVEIICGNIAAKHLRFMKFFSTTTVFKYYGVKEKIVMYFKVNLHQSALQTALLLKRKRHMIWVAWFLIRENTRPSEPAAYWITLILTWHIPFTFKLGWFDATNLAFF